MCSAAVRAAREVPDEPGVHVAEQQVARVGASRPRRRRCRGSSGSSGRRSRSRAAARPSPGSGPGRRPSSTRRPACRCACPARRARCGSARPSSGPTRRAVSRWLVMPDARDVVGARAGRLHRLVDDLLGARPDLRRVVLDPARLGIDLLVLLLRDADDLAAVVEDHAPRARGALIDRCRVLGHQASSLSGLRAARPEPPGHGCGCLSPGRTALKARAPRTPPMSGPTTGIQE